MPDRKPKWPELFWGKSLLRSVLDEKAVICLVSDLTDGEIKNVTDLCIRILVILLRMCVLFSRSVPTLGRNLPFTVSRRPGMADATSV